jgi:[acyl-carrier-protein] S-malonyltransferase
VRARDADELADNRTSQLLTVAASLALYACIDDILPEDVAVTGYSVGEMAAWLLPASGLPTKRCA